MNNKDHRAMMLSQVRDEVGRADNKASILLATLGVAFGVVAGAILNRDVDYVNLTSGERFLLWTAAFCAALSLAASGSSIWPRRFSVSGTNRLLSWADIARYSQFSEFQFATRQQADDDLLLDSQLWTLARLVQRKFFWIRAALILASISVLSIGALAVVQI